MGAHMRSIRLPDLLIEVDNELDWSREDHGQVSIIMSVLIDVEGDHQYPESEQCERWPFNEAPRALRIRAATKIPKLLKELDRAAQEMVKKVSASIDKTAPILEALEESSRPQRSIKKKPGGRS